MSSEGKGVKQYKSPFRKDWTIYRAANVDDQTTFYHPIIFDFCFRWFRRAVMNAKISATDIFVFLSIISGCVGLYEQCDFYQTMQMGLTYYIYSPNYPEKYAPGEMVYRHVTSANHFLRFFPCHRYVVPVLCCLAIQLVHWPQLWEYRYTTREYKGIWIFHILSMLHVYCTDVQSIYQSTLSYRTISEFDLHSVAESGLHVWPSNSFKVWKFRSLGRSKLLRERIVQAEIRGEQNEYSGGRSRSQPRRFVSLLN